MTEGERIKQVRKERGMTQEKFGEKLGIKKSAISKIERGENGVTDQLRILICHIFEVSERWLTTGEGEMKEKQTRVEELSQFFDTLEVDKSFKWRLISILSQLTVDEWGLLLKMGRKLKEEYTEAQADAEIEEEVESYRQQLLAERGGGLSASFRNYGGGAGGSGDDSDKLA